MSFYDPSEDKLMAATQASCGVGQYIPPTARQQLLEKRNAIKGELAKIDAALSALDAHPELEEFTETLKRALR